MAKASRVGVISCFSLSLFAMQDGPSMPKCRPSHCKAEVSRRLTPPLPSCSYYQITNWRCNTTDPLSMRRCFINTINTMRQPC